jgi:hypothetical protein
MDQFTSVYIRKTFRMVRFVEILLLESTDYSQILPILNGSNFVGNDRLYHGLGTPDDSKTILSDGHKDTIECGSREDSVWINTSVDHGVATNCEHVHAG